ncbi:mechanosensitive ion channel protein MscS [Altererythrobacter sp. B11]|uniref:mechanosensitive ion channel family protein n=1 Tax=Altererythrobacter sp. B11 TaxID=2060312 RepID=UPI000DC6F982|nr:mechanosensitive ion channel family protein [Altererythrobacter sp. B11]BBC73687.1 mechanosensitive ion channel protein MscS [Altererythrobacter sp. B11]
MDYVAIIRDQLVSMQMQAVALTPKLVIAIIVLVITWLVAKFATRIAELVVGKTSMRESLRLLVETAARLVIWIMGLLIAAAIVIPGFTPAGLIAGLGIGAVAIGFAFQDIFENFFAGVLIMLREKMQIGDMIEVEGVLGKVENITLRETHIRHYSNELTIMPNSMIFKNAVKIYTDAHERRNEIIVGVAYDTDLAKASAVIRKAVEGIAELSPNHGVDVYAQEFNSSSIDFLVRWWIDIRQHDYFGVKNDVVFAIKKALDEAGIEIPFPYVTQTFKEPLPLTRPDRD